MPKMANSPFSFCPHDTSVVESKFTQRDFSSKPQLLRELEPNCIKFEALEILIRKRSAESAGQMTQITTEYQACNGVENCWKKCSLIGSNNFYRYCAPSINFTHCALHLCLKFVWHVKLIRCNNARRRKRREFIRKLIILRFHLKFSILLILKF